MRRIFSALLCAAVLLCSVPIAGQAEGSTIMIQSFQVENMDHPLGLDSDAAPRFSWKLKSQDRGAAQSAYRLTVGTLQGGSDLWDTGWVESTAQNREYSGAALSDQTKYYCTLTVKDAAGTLSQSADNTFETGILDQNWGVAAWIGGGSTKRLRKEFTIGKQVKQARAYIAGVGYYELLLNGEKVGESVLESPTGEFYKRVRYATFDVTSHLQQGNNAIGIFLGAGVLIGRLSSETRKARMILVFDYVDGSRETVATGKDWTASDTSPVVSDSIYSGETYDARLEDGWTMPGYTGEDWKAATLAGQNETYYMENGALVTYQCNEVLAPTGQELTDYTIETDVTLGQIGGGIVFRARDAKNFCMWQIRDGLLRAHVKTNGAYTVAKQVPFASAPNPLKVKIEVSGNTAKTTINGVLIDTSDISAFPKGTVGFRSATNEMSTYSSFLVTAPNGNKLFDLADAAKWSDKSVFAPYMSAQKQDIRVMERNAPQKVTDIGGGKYIVDAGQNHTGWLNLKNITVPAGTQITMRYAELLYKDGTLDDTSMRRETVNTYIAKGGTAENYTPKFFFTTFRYVEVSGLPSPPAVENFEICKVYSNMDTIGTFKSSNQLLNQIQDAYVESQTSNMVSVPMDCPQREKQGWLGDAHVTSESALYALDAAQFYDKWMEDLTDTMKDDGFLNLISPDLGNITGPGTLYGVGDICWTIAMVSIPWDMYQVTGDTTYLSRHYTAMKKYIQWWVNKGGAVTLHWDWVGKDKNKISKQMFADAYYCHALDLMGQIAAALGKDSDEATYRNLFETEKEAFNVKWYKNGYYDTNTQGANATALSFGLVQEENVAKVMDNLENNIMVTNKGHLTTGLTATKNLMDALTNYNRPDLAYAINTQTTYPSFGYMITSGATTLWEYWEHIHCDTEPEKYPGQTPWNPSAWQSQNHCFLGGGYGTWVYEALGGIAPAAPGYETVQIKPQIPLDLQWVTAQVDTVKGVVKSAWKRDAQNNLTLEVQIPVGSIGKISVPVRGSLDRVTVKEGADVLYQNGAAKDTALIAFDGAEDGYVSFRVPSGDYIFTMTGEGKYPFEEYKEYGQKADANLAKGMAVPAWTETFAGNVFDSSLWAARGELQNHLKNGRFEKTVPSNWASLLSKEAYGKGTAISAMLSVQKQAPDNSYTGQYLGIRNGGNKVISEGRNNGLWFGINKAGNLTIGSNELQKGVIALPCNVDFTTPKRLEVMDFGDWVEVYAYDGADKVLLASVKLDASSYTIYDKNGEIKGTNAVAVNQSGNVGMVNWGVASTVDDLCISNVCIISIFRDGKQLGGLKEGVLELQVELPKEAAGALFYAQYDRDHKLLHVKEVSQPMLTVTVGKGDEGKMFLWKDTVNLLPLTQPLELT